MIHKNSKHVVPPNDSSLPEIPQPHMGLYLPPNDSSSPTGGPATQPIGGETEPPVRCSALVRRLPVDHHITLKKGQKLLIYAADESQAKDLYTSMNPDWREVLQVAIRPTRSSGISRHYP